MDQRIANPKSLLTTTTPYTSGKKIRELWSTYKKVIKAHVIANIFGTDRHVESGENEKPSSTTTPSMLDQKMVNFVSQTTEL